MEAVEAAFALACLQEVPAQYEQARGLGLLGRGRKGRDAVAPPRILTPPRLGMGGGQVGGSSSMGGGGPLRQPISPPQPTGRQPASCVVCLDAPRDCVLLPCGHTCLCLACAGVALRQPGRQGVCPICRGAVTAFNKIFLS